jgi:hypothetical protein
MGGNETAGPSTALRSGSTAGRDRRDDKFIAQDIAQEVIHKKICHPACPGLPWNRSEA